MADFRLLVEGFNFSMKLKKIGITNHTFDEEAHGQILRHLLLDNRNLREFELSTCEFVHPKCFFDMSQALISDKCRLHVMKLKGLHIS